MSEIHFIERNHLNFQGCYCTCTGGFSASEDLSMNKLKVEVPLHCQGSVTGLFVLHKTVSPEYLSSLKTMCIRTR